MFKRDNPKVALLSIGAEKEKGNILTLAAHQLLAENKLINFVGNAEGRDLFNDKADVIVCDGFTGNVVLKSCQSIFTLCISVKLPMIILPVLTMKTTEAHQYWA